MSGVDWPRPGIYSDMPADVYHADPCKEPSLSSGVAKKLLTRSPLHAWHAHPRLNPAYEAEPASGQLDFGSAAHSILLEGLDVCTEIPGFDDWRKKVAQELRDQARASGLVPLLSKDYERMLKFVAAVRDQIAGLDVEPLPLCDGKPEQTLIWKEGDLWCRARTDWLHNDKRTVDDLKTTGTSANPREWARRRLFADGYDLQSAFYTRGLRTLNRHIEPVWRFVVAEVDPPFALSVISLAPAGVELASQKVERALDLWGRSLKADSWPGYTREIAYAEPPGWQEAAFLEAHYEPEEALT